MPTHTKPHYFAYIHDENLVYLMRLSLVDVQLRIWAVSYPFQNKNIFHLVCSIIHLKTLRLCQMVLCFLSDGGLFW